MTFPAGEAPALCPAVCACPRQGSLLGWHSSSPVTVPRAPCCCCMQSLLQPPEQLSLHPPRLLHVRNGNCKYHLGEETFKLAQSYMDKLAKHGQQANKAALYGELCALLFAKSHYDEVSFGGLCCGSSSCFCSPWGLRGTATAVTHSSAVVFMC